MSDWSMKEGDLAPSIPSTLYVDGAILVLTGCTVKFVMTPAGETTPVIDRAATIVDAAAGKVRYDWQAGDTAKCGRYTAVWKVTLTSSKQLTVPSEGFLQIVIGHNL